MSGGEKLEKLRHFDKKFRIKHKKKGPHSETFWSFFLRFSQNYILNGKLNPKMDTIKDFLYQNF